MLVSTSVDNEKKVCLETSVFYISIKDLSIYNTGQEKSFIQRFSADFGKTVTTAVLM